MLRALIVTGWLLAGAALQEQHPGSGLAMYRIALTGTPPRAPNGLGWSNELELRRP